MTRDIIGPIFRQVDDNMAEEALQGLIPTDPRTAEEVLARAENAELASFNKSAAKQMLLRLRDGARKFGATSWRDSNYSDDDNADRLIRAVDHLFGVLARWRDPELATLADVPELWKRAADVANQAFMLADPLRREGDAPFTRAGYRIEAAGREAETGDAS